MKSLLAPPIALFIALAPATLEAFSLGSPICEVNSLPLVEMSPTLADPPPTGWSIEVRPWYVPGQSQSVRIRNLDPAREVRGVLLWAKSGPSTGAGSFALDRAGRYQHIPAPAPCGQWALSHTSAAVKSQSDLVFDWTPPASGGTVILRAFLIEDCGQPSGGCRSHQALTPVTVLVEALFVDGFEQGS